MAKDIQKRWERIEEDLIIYIEGVRKVHQEDLKSTYGLEQKYPNAQKEFK
jgi:hypothetical protein